MADLDGRIFKKVEIGPHKLKVLRPADIHADEWFDKIKLNQEVMLTGRRPRNPKHHRLLFAVLRIVINNTEGVWADEEDLLDDLKDATGLSTTRLNPLNNKTVTRVGSISFAAMDQDKFSRWFDRATYVLATEVLGCQTQELVDQVLEMTQHWSPSVEGNVEQEEESV